MTLFGDFVTGQTLSFQRMRALLLEGGGGLQEGVVGANDLKVAQRGAGANMSVDIPVGAAWVQIDTGTRNGLAHVYSDATANVAVTASNATNPRIDQAILRYNDTSIPTGSGNTPTLEMLAGTATAGATLDNRTGATALPNDCLRLADILVPAASTSVTTANIRDRRPWARGVSFTGPAAPGSIVTLTAATWTNIDGQYRFELSAGNQLRLTASAQITAPILLGTLVDGVTRLAIGQAYGQATSWGSGASIVFPPGTLAAGSHTFQTQALSPGGTSISALGGFSSYEEIVRQNSSNT